MPSLYVFFSFMSSSGLIATQRTRITPTLLQEIITVYAFLSPPTLTGRVSNRICSVIARNIPIFLLTRGISLNGISSCGTYHLGTIPGRVVHVSLCPYPSLDITPRLSSIKFLKFRLLSVRAITLDLTAPGLLQPSSFRRPHLTRWV